MQIKTLADVCRLAAAGFTDWLSEGEVTVTERDGLMLFNYNREAQFKKAVDWTPLEKLSRGLIIEKARGYVVARPFDKFFNLGELDPEPGATLKEVTVKWDGSLGILHYVAGKWRVTTRGSFESEQGIWATEKLKDYDVDKLDKMHTYLLEIIYPDNRIVIDYGKLEALIMIGMRDNIFGTDYWHSEYSLIAKSAGFQTTATMSFDDLDKVWASAESLSANEEGYVCRFSDGTRLKVKGGAYRTAHKWIAGTTPKAVFDAMTKGSIDDMRSTVPDIYKGLFEQYVSDIEREYADTKARIETIFQQSPHTADRKTFALWVMEHHKQDQGYLFARLDGRDLLAHLYKAKYN